jgi:hypothetical protein
VIGDERRLRAELEWLQTKYDSGAVSDAVFAVVKELETDSSWIESRRAEQEGRRV